MTTGYKRNREKYPHIISIKIDLKRLTGYTRVRVRVRVFNFTFNNISVISWWSVLLVEETGVP